MFKFGASNWIKYGWGDRLSSDITPGDKLIIDVSNDLLPVKKMYFLEAAWEAIDHITKNYPPPYTLMCSGGIDSQSMLYAWIKSGHPFSIASVRYISNGTWFNVHDLNTLFKVARHHNLPVTYYNFDIIDFLENGELQKYATMYDCTSPHITTYMKMSEVVSAGTILYSGNVITRASTSMSYPILGLQRYASSIAGTARELIPFFFLHTPSLAYSLSFADNSLSKDTPYSNAGVPLVFPEKKFSGFEHIKDYYDKIESTVPAALKRNFVSRPSRRAFDLLFRYMLEGEKPSPKVESKILTKITTNFVLA
jgi:hypothetical protein